MCNYEDFVLYIVSGYLPARVRLEEIHEFLLLKNASVILELGFEFDDL